MQRVPGILVVEDEPEIADILKEVLDQTGYFVYTMNSLSRDSLDPFFQAVTIDIVVTDFRLPGFNGHDVRRTARFYHPDCKVILVSGYHEIPESERFDEFFNKLDLSSARFQPLLNAIPAAHKLLPGPEAARAG